VVTSDRDAYQLVSDAVTVVRPIRGVAEVERVDPAGVRERYGVEPAQVPDFIALRGDPSDRIPGARGIGPKKAAEILARFGALEHALAAGRFPGEGEVLLGYRQIATMQAEAPIPPLPDREPDWSAAGALVERWGLGALAGRLRSCAEVDHLNVTGVTPRTRGRRTT